MATIFSTPGPAHQQSTFQRSPSSRSLKRKRNTTYPEGTNQLPPSSDSTHAPQGSTSKHVPEEYTAVISPDERAQRGLAHYPFIGPLPPPPFPHSPYVPAHFEEGDEPKRKSYTRNHAPSRNEATSGQQSLRSQHLAALSAVLHKSLQNKDYIRASRALGLILRTDVNGQPVDIRAAGNWAVGAEILFRRDLQYRQQHVPEHGRHAPHRQNPLPFTRQGFEHAKELYENLIVQHPYNKSWVNSVSALDFHLALFSLWIYVAQAEATQQLLDLESRQSNDLSLDYLAALQDVKLSQLRRANEIEQRMGKCMTSMPYSENKDLLRMRAMLALWRADLSDASQEPSSVEMEQENDNPVVEADAVADAVGSLVIGDSGSWSSQLLARSALDARVLARQTFRRLGIEQEEDD